MKCSICDERVKRSETYFGDEGTFYEGKPLCESCYYEDEPCATVIYSNDEQPYIISETRNETEGDFRVKWHSTDPWRGYYEAMSEKYSLVNTAELLAWHESEKMLKDFDERIRELFDEHEIDYARVFARSSNVFYQNYDIYVKRDQALLAGLLVTKAKNDVDYGLWQFPLVHHLVSPPNSLVQCFLPQEVSKDALAFPCAIQFLGLL